jgi:hypothetical protein
MSDRRLYLRSLFAALGLFVLALAPFAGLALAGVH